MKLIIGSILLLVLSSCSKEVSNNSNSLTPSTNPVIEVPEDTSGVLKMNFANHAVQANEDDELTTYKAGVSLLLTLPTTLSITYSNLSYKPNLTLTVNNQNVCTYVWFNGAYRMSSSCYVEIDFQTNDVISVKNIPKAQTVSVSVQYQK